MEQHDRKGLVDNAFRPEPVEQNEPSSKRVMTRSVWRSRSPGLAYHRDITRVTAIALFAERLVDRRPIKPTQPILFLRLRLRSELLGGQRDGLGQVLDCRTILER